MKRVDLRHLQPEWGLERLLQALENDVIEATDEEILAAARELGMNPAMKGSSAFFGVTMLARFRKKVPREAARRKGAPTWKPR